MIIGLAASGQAALGRHELRNGYFDLSGEGPTLEAVRVAPAGDGKYGRNLIVGIAPDEVVAGPQSSWHRVVDGLDVSGLKLVASVPLEVRGESADLLQPGHTLGQRFHIARGTFTEVRAHVPTWRSATSAMTLTLRRADGSAVASKRCETVPDNSHQSLTFAPQAPGTYTLEMSEPNGTIGWWTASNDRLGQGEALADGQPTAGRDRSLFVNLREDVGDVTLHLALVRNRLTLAAALTPAVGQAARAIPLTMRTPWTQSGYDVTPKANVLFSRFYTDNQRYMPVEQLKRRDAPGLSFGPCRWVEADGTTGADLRFSGRRLTLDWTMTGHGMALHFGAKPTSKPGGASVTTLSLEVKPRADDLPADWPSFFSSEGRLDADLNTFFYERALTYPSACGPAPWLEWSALIRFWFAGEMREGERRNLEGQRISEEGYVYTWGSAPGWPFPDNAKYDTRHFDTNARFILAAWRYFCWTGDGGFLKAQASRLRRAMAYQLNQLQGKGGLIITNSKDTTGKHEGVGTNYWDILPFGHLDAYCNIYFYASLEAMAQLEEAMGRLPASDGRAPRLRPAYYRGLATRARQAYNETFWDEAKGRYIGCVDTDGARHDYGFTFINLEAMAYGLADEQKARRIYHWMETEATSTGRADTYTHWVFAPRATTVHNPKWGGDEKWNDAPGPVPPWWHFGWHGTDFGDQCQDGGAILYTSFYDLMSRVRLLGADNAFRRFNEILVRYREPDRMCGGPPLFRGEIPQQENPGSVGVDLPFPESGLVPCYFLYGVIGLQAARDGLVITPRLPSSLTFAGVRKVTYRNLPLTIIVTKTSVKVLCAKPGYAFTIRKQIPPGGAFVFRNPPAPVPGFPPVQTGPATWTARWIWFPGERESENSTVFFRHTFALRTSPAKAVLHVAADNAYTLFVNGRQVGQGNDWTAADRYELRARLRFGRNVLAVRAHNVSGPCGLLVEGEIVGGGQIVKVRSDASWKVAKDASDGWPQPVFDDGGWRKAEELGAPPIPPWGDVERTAEDGASQG